MLKNLADLFRGLFGRRHRKTDANSRRREFLNQFRKSRMEGLEDRALMAAFTEGNLVVSRIGDGAATLTSAANPISLAEFTTTGTAQTAVNIVSLPSFSTGGNNQGGFTDSGTATSNGMLNRSPNGQFLSLVGIDAQVGTASVTGTSAATANRNVANIPNSGVVSVEARLTDAFTTNNARSAVTTNGDDYWIAGTGTSPTDGVRYVNAATGTPTTSTQIAAGNLRNAAIFGGVLFTSGTTSISTYNAPSSPPTATATGTPITFTTGGMASGSGSFIFFDRDGATGATNLNGLDTLYFVDGSAIEKYEWTGSGWTQRGSATYSGTLFSVTAAVNGANVDLYATTNLASNNALIKATDTTGFGGTLNVVAAGFTTLANAGTNFGFRGLAFAPIAGAPTVTTPTSASITDTTATLGGNVTAGSGITERGVVYSLTSTNNDPLIGGTGVTKVIEGGTTTGVFTTPITGLTASSGYSFKAYAINSNGTSYSSLATFTTQAPAAAHQAPSGTDKSLTFNEDSTYTFAAADFAFTDADVPAQSLNRVRITTLPALGTLTLGGNAVAAGDFVATASIPTLVYTPVAGASGAPSSTFTFQVEDTGSTAGGGQILDATPNTITLNVNSVNDAPSGTDKTVSASTASGYTFTASDFGFSDANDAPPNSLLAVKITTLPSAGTLTNDGAAVTVGQSIAVADITAFKLVFTAAGGATPGAAYATFTFQVQDNGTTANGGVDLDPTANTITIDLFATTTLAAGDIAVIGYNTSGTPTDSFTILILKDLAAGTSFFINDNEVTTAGDPGFTDLNEGEATFTVKAGQTVAAGTVITLPWGSTAVSTTTYDYSATTGFGLGNNNEELFIYTAPAITATTPTAFIFGAKIGSSPTAMPSGLTTATTFISPTGTASRYKTTGATYSGTQAQLLSSIGDIANNWEALAPVNDGDWTFSVLNIPEINVQGGGLNIADGDTTPATADGTDFGAAVQGGANVDRTFTIQNLGSQPLVLSGGPNFVTVTGGSNFSILTQPASGSIAAGGSATFVVRMTPTAVATQTATVSITSNDLDEATYDFAVTSVVTSSAAATTTALTTVTPLTAAAGDSITFAGTIVAGSGTATPIGTVEIRNGGASGTLLASTTTIGGTGVNGTFNIVSTTVPSGTYNSIQAFFVPGAGFQASNSATFSGTLDIAAAATYVTYGTAGATYSQNFDALINTGSVTLTGNGPFHLADPQFATTPITGWYFSKFSGTGSNALFNVNDGSLGSGSIYSYGAAAATDRALGTVASGSTVSRFGAVIRNTTGSLLDTFTITFDGEQWRNGVGSSTAANVLDFEYAVGVASGGSIDGTGFTGDSNLDFTAPVTNSTEGAIDGNTAGRTAGITRTISGISWAAGTDLIIRWSDLNDTGNDDGLGIDGFTFTAATNAPNGSLSFSAPTYNVTENGVTATVTVNRVGNTAGAIGVTYSTVAGGTAVAGTDYTTTTGTLSWAANDNAPQQFTIPITDNLTLNANRTINIALSNPTGGATLAGNTTGVVTIRENEQAPLVLLNELAVNPPTSNDRPYEFVEVRGTASSTLGSYYVVQIDGGSTTPANAGNVWFLAELSTAALGSNGLLVVKAATGGHATTAPTTEVGSPLLDVANGRGLINTAQTIALIFSPSGLTLDQDLDTNDDGTLDLPVGAVLVDSVGWKDNSDLNAGLYAGFVYGGAEIYNTPYPLAGSGTPDAASRFYNNDTANTAAAWFGGDLQDTGDPTSLAYDPAKATANLPVGAIVSPSIPNSGLSIAPVSGSLSQNEGSGGTTVYTFNISRAGDLSAAVDVTWTVTGSGTNPATAVDFDGGVFPTGLASFAINEAVKQITVTVNGDTDIEATERFTVTLSNPTNGATLASPTTNATIVNDDFQTFVAGDIVLTGINTTNPDQFSFVTLVALQPFSSINFTDNGWDNNSLGFTTTEGVVTYSAPAGGLAAGTKVIIQVDGANVTVPTGGGTAAVSSGSFGLNAGGESLFAFSGTLLLPNLLFGLTTNTSYITTGTPTTSESYLPAALTIGTSAVAPFETTVSASAQYTGATTGTAAALRALVADEANWTTSSTVLTLSTTNFTISGANQAPTDIALTPATIAENAGANATVGTFSSTDPNAGDTFTYTLVTGTGDTHNSAFNISGSTLRANASFDFETQSSYSVRVRSTDQGGAFFEEAFTITVTDVTELGTLHVSTLTAGQSHIAVRFSKPIDAAQINLFDSNNVFGPSDVTITGASSGVLAGSVVMDADNQGFKFVKTGGLLAADTYTVTLRSGAANGFVALVGGGQLDGNADGTAGDNYSNTVTVTAPVLGTITVGVGDFVRGAGQAVNLPANTTNGIPITLSTGVNVAGASFTLHYNPALLTIFSDTDPTTPSTTPIAGALISVNTSVPGQVTVVVASGSEFSSTGLPITIANLRASVPNTAPLGSKAFLDLQNVTVTAFDTSTLPSIGDDGVQIAAFKGDTNNSGTITPGDVTALLRSISGVLNTTGYPSLNSADQALIGDMNDSNSISPGDVTGLLRFQSGASGGFPAIPAIPTGFTPVLGADPQVYIPTNLAVSPGASVQVPVYLKVTEPNVSMSGFRVDIVYDAVRFNFGGFTPGPAMNAIPVGYVWASSNNTATDGFIRILQATEFGPDFSVGYDDVLFYVTLTASGTAAAGPSSLNVQVVQIDDNNTSPLLISPAPLPGADVNDGTVTVTTPPVAPSDLTLSATFIAENAGTNATVGTFTTTDANAGDTHSYTLVTGTGSTDNSLFTIVGNTLQANASFDFETQPGPYSIQVRTTDSGTLFFEKQFTITVTNLNEAPTVTPATFTLAENSASGTTVGTVTATDPDLGDTIASWAITGGNTGGAFAISNTGVITVANAAAVDFEANPTFNLSVTATDAGGLTSAAGTVTINLTDVFEAISPIYINEILMNPQGSDTGNEYIELRGTPNAPIPVGTYLVGIEGNAGAGDVQDIFNLGGLTFGSNGLLLLLQKGSLYDTSAATTAGTTVVTNTGAGVGWGNGVDSILGSGSHNGDNSPADIENASSTFLLINSSVAPLLSDDIDALDNGTPGGVYASWTILDSLGLLSNSGAPNFGYAAINFVRQGGTAISVTGPTITVLETEYGGRVGNSTGSTTSDWISGDTTGSNDVPPYVLSTATNGVSNPAYRGTPLNHVGLPNNFTLVAPTDISLGNDSIPENAAPGSTIGQFTTTDPSTTDTHTYTLVSGTGSTDNSAFTLTTAGVLTINASANFEVKPSYSIRVRSTDSTTITFEKVFTISVTNVNETPTDIALSNATLAENAGANAVVGTLSGTDVDVPETLTFSLPVGVTNNGLFNISGTSLRANTSFDFEAGSSYTVTVRVTDAGGLFYDEAFPITITDVNEAPVFGLASYSFPLAENSATGVAVGGVSATDQDAGASLTYSLSGTGSSNFEINPTTGAVTVAAGAVLNFEGTNVFNLTAGVTDGTNPVSVPVTISLTNVNETPTINAQTFSVSEQAPVGASVGTVAANDVDAGDVLTYAITAGNTGSAFAINPSTGAITVAAALDFNTTPVYTLTVSVTDVGLLSASNTVTINVTNVNSAPTINPQTFTVAENSVNGAAVGTVVATDIDSGDTLSYAITAGNTGSAFAINSSTGAITVANGSLLNFEGTSSYALTVSVTDNGLPVGSSSATITINLTNVNEAPTDINLSAASVAENQPAGTPVGTFTTLDPDLGNTHSYALVAGTGATHNALFTIVGGELRTGIDFDFEAGNILSVRVSSTDQGGLSFEKVFNITVTNVNEAPTIAPQTFSVAENAASGTAVGTVVANDVDAGDSKTFAITAGNTGSAFAINPSTGAITVANGSLLNFEGTPSYSLTVSVTDAGNLSASNTVTINLTNVNEAPTVTSGGAFSVPENTTAVTTVTANDPDTITTLAYSIVGGADAAKFTIDQDLGLLAFLSSPNFESPTDVGGNNVYDLIVRVSDGSLSNDKPIAVTVTGVNEAPVIANQTFGVLDTVPNGTAVGTVVASDPDAGDTRTFVITAGNSSGAFAINSATGQITVADASQLNYLVTPTYSLTVTATDAGNLTGSGTITISVSHTNRAPTALALSNNTVAENAGANAVVGTLSTTDLDLPSDSHAYTLVPGTGSTDNASFNIAGNQLRATAGFDYETKNSYSVRVRTTDQGGSFVERVFTIYVTDVIESGNQAPSNITLSANIVSPTATAGAPIGNLTTTDPNSGDTHTYSLGGVDAANFQITGAVLRVAAPYNGSQATYSITVTSTDQGGLFVTKSFTIVRQVPVNVAPTYLALSANQIAENAGTNAVVGGFSSTDANIGDTFTYTLVAGTGSTDNASFNIAGTQLRANASFDFETKNSYSVRVRTTDAGGLFFERVFTIYVTDLVETGNQAPVNITLSAATVSPTAPANTLIGNISTSDPNPGDTHTYTLGGADAANFTIVGNALRTTATYNGSQPTYAISITTTDQGGLFFTKNFTITRAVPVNTAPTYVALSVNQIAENAGANALVGTFTTTDANAGDTHTYSLVSGTGSANNSAFVIVGNELRAVASFDYETKSSYSIRVRTTDQGGLSFDRVFTIYVTNGPG